MSEQVKRSYRSAHREDQARLTRARIRDAATELFIDRGYTATSIAAIAQQAGVAPQTVYGTFGTKAALLNEAVNVALAGDDEPIAIADRPESQAVFAATTAAAAARGFASTTTAILSRAGRLLHVADEAARQDDELRPLWIAGNTGRFHDMRRTVQSFADAGFLRLGLTVDNAANLLWTMTSPDVFTSFIVIRDWSPRRFERWLRETIEQTLFVSDDGAPD